MRTKESKPAFAGKGGVVMDAEGKEEILVIGLEALKDGVNADVKEERAYRVALADARLAGADERTIGEAQPPVSLAQMNVALERHSGEPEW